MPSETVDVPEGADVSVKNKDGKVTVSWEDKSPCFKFNADGYCLVLTANSDMKIISNDGGHYDYTLWTDKKEGVNGHSTNTSNRHKHDGFGRSFHFDTIELVDEYID